MNFVYLCSYIILAILTSPAMANDLPSGSFSENKSFAAILSSGDIQKLMNESSSMVDAIASSNAPPKKEKLFVIGEVALSLAAKSLDKLYEDNQSSAFIEAGELTGLYSEMSSAFGIKKIPIKLSKYGPQEEQISTVNNLSSKREPISGQYLDQFEPISPVFHIFEISGRHRESSGGVDVIWDY